MSPFERTARITPSRSFHKSPSGVLRARDVLYRCGSALEPIAITLSPYKGQVVLERGDSNSGRHRRIIRCAVHLHRRLTRDVDRHAAIVGEEDFIRLEEDDVVAVGRN